MIPRDSHVLVKLHSLLVVAAMKIALWMEIPLQRSSVITRAYSFEITKRSNVGDDGLRLRTTKDDINDVMLLTDTARCYACTRSRIRDVPANCSLSACTDYRTEQPANGTKPTGGALHPCPWGKRGQSWRAGATKKMRSNG